MKTLLLISTIALSANFAFAAANTVAQPKKCTMNGVQATSASVGVTETENHLKSYVLVTQMPDIPAKGSAQAQKGFNHQVVVLFKNADGSAASIPSTSGLSQSVAGQVVTLASSVNNPQGTEKNNVVTTLNSDNSVKSVQLTQTVGSSQFSETCQF